MQRHGNMAVILTLSVTVLLGFGAVAMDIGYARSVDLELRNAAEAASHAATSQLDGTEEGMIAARATAVALAARNVAGGVEVELDANDGNLMTGDVVTGVWDDDVGVFIPSEDFELVNAVRVRPRKELPLLVAPMALGTDSVNLTDDAAMVAIRGGAGAVDCYIPLAVPVCLVTTYGVEGMMDVDLHVSPAGIDNLGWGRANGSPNSDFSRNQIANCRSDGIARIGDPIGLQSGTVTPALSELAAAVEASATLWDVEKWGALPARLSGSGISAPLYGHTLEGPILVFDDGGTYCNTGGSFNQTKPLAAFMWAAIYDVKDSGSAASRNIKMRLDTMEDHNVGTALGGPDYGVTRIDKPRMIADRH